MVALGVVMAVAANAWWEWYQDRLRRAVQLENLLAVTNENRRHLEAGITFDSLAADRADRAIWAIRTPGSATPDSIVSWMFRSLYFSDFHPRTGLYNSVILSGDLVLMSDSLRTLVPQYLGAIEGAADQMRVYDQQSIRNIAEMGLVVDLVHVSAWWNYRDGIWPQFSHIPPEAMTKLRPPNIVNGRDAVLQRALMNNYINSMNRTYVLHSLLALNARLTAELMRELQSVKN